MVQSMESDIDTSIGNNENFENLRILIGDEKYIELFGVDGELKDYIDIEGMIKVDGQNKPISYLIELINKMNNGEIDIIEVEVE